MDLEERFEYAGGQYAPGRKLSEAEVAALFKQLRAQDPTRMRVIEAVLAEAAAHDVITRRRKIKLEQDEEGLIDAVLTIVIGVNDKGKIKVAMASRRVVDATMHTGSLKMYMGSPMRPELKERLYRGHELRIHINECEGKTEEAKEREAASRFGSGQETAAQQYAMNNPTEKSKAQRFGGDGVSATTPSASPSTPRDKNGEYIFRQGQCKGDFKLHVDEVDSDGEPLDEPLDADDSDYDSDDDDGAAVLRRGGGAQALKPHFEVQREIADMTRPALKRALKEAKLNATGRGRSSSAYLHRTASARRPFCRNKGEHASTTPSLPFRRTTLTCAPAAGGQRDLRPLVGLGELDLELPAGR
ncbi:hypothetical protein JL720_13723 [Aureococcus anophagefferens]|nr:hypothetical protein JL720_13723 [Aureococcus anophagefferens]